MGYSRCSVSGCKSRIGKGILFKRWPEDRNLSKKWSENFPIFAGSSPPWLSPKNAAVCEKHFPISQFERPRQDGRKKLRFSAIPSWSPRKPFSNLTNFTTSTESTIVDTEYPPLILHDHNYFWISSTTPSTITSSEETQNLDNSQDITPVLHSNPATRIDAQVLQSRESQNIDSSQEMTPILHSTPATATDAQVRQSRECDRLMEIIGQQRAQISRLTSANVEALDNMLVTFRKRRDKSPLPSPVCRRNVFEVSMDGSQEMQDTLDDCLGDTNANESDQVHATLSEQRQLIVKLTEENEESKRKIKIIEELSRSPPFRRKYLALHRRYSRLQQRFKRRLYSPWLTENQQKAITRGSNRGVQWGPTEIAEGLELKMKCGTSGYHSFITKYPLLPSVRNLQRSVQFIRFDSGLLHDIFDMLESLVVKMNPISKDCIILLDEMAIAEGHRYDPSLKKWVGSSTLPTHKGLARKALVIILAGMSFRWRVAVAVYFTNKKDDETAKDKSNKTGEVYKNILDSVVLKTEQIGLIPCGIAGDMGADNLSFWKAYGVNGGRKDTEVKTSFPSPTREGKQLFILPDSVHLLKAIKTMMENNIIITLPADIVDEEGLPCAEVNYSHIDDLYELESNNELKVAFRLKPWNVHCQQQFKKMGMATTRAVVCHRTAVGLELLAEEKEDPSYRTTAWFVELINTFFELATCRSKVLAVSKYNQEAFEKVIKLIEKMDYIFQHMLVGKEGHWKPCQRGMRVLCASMIGLIDYFLTSRCYRYLMLGRLTTDCLENLFSLVRFRQPVPHAVAFFQCLKVITLAQFSQAVKGSSYDYDETIPIADIDFLEEARKRAKERTTARFYESLDELFANPVRRITPEDYATLPEIEKCVIYDMAGSVLAHLKTSNHNLCDICLNAAMWKRAEQHPYSKITAMKEFTYFKSSKKKDPLQIYVSDQVFKAIMSAEITFRMYRGKTLNFKNYDVLRYFTENLMYVWSNACVPSCHNLGRKILEYFIQGRLKEYGKIQREAIVDSNSKKTTIENRNTKSVAMREAANKILVGKAAPKPQVPKEQQTKSKGKEVKKPTETLIPQNAAPKLQVLKVQQTKCKGTAIKKPTQTSIPQNAAPEPQELRVQQTKCKGTAIKKPTETVIPKNLRKKTTARQPSEKALKKPKAENDKENGPHIGKGRKL